jgi:hypothetical protein
MFTRGTRSGRPVKLYMFDVARLVEKHEALGEAFDMVFRKNEAMIRRLPGNSFVFVEFEEGGGVLKIAAFALGAAGLDVAKRIEALLELAGKALAMQAERGEEAMGVDNIKVDSRLFVGRIGGAREQLGFEEGDAVEPPGGVGEFLGELGLGGSGRLVFVEELLDVTLIRGWIFGGENGAAGGQAVAEGVE